MTDLAQSAPASMATTSSSLKRDALAIAIIIAVAAVGFFLFPNNLALLSRIVIMMLIVLSLDLVTGYGGIATLGQAAISGSGAYAAGIAAAHFGIIDPLAMLAVGAVGGALAGLVSSVIILRGHGLAQLVLSIAIVQLAHEAANKASAWTGGSDGLSGIAPSPVFGLFQFDLWGRTTFFLAVALLIVVFFLLRLIMRSPFGMLCRAIREDPVRVRAMGAAVKPTLIKLYVLSGAVAGLGGALHAISTRVVGLDSVSFNLSAEALVMLVLGGTGNLFGAMIGTLVFVWFEDLVSSINPFHWLTMVGVLLVAVVLFAPRGLTGAAEDIYRRLRRDREAGK
ncbi:branched-chain amino acid ABC transporter permease [Devosia sp. D6-9]|nr:branched-chain amino acid ABC transporter permease [Devosia sp. D6-9]